MPAPYDYNIEPPINAFQRSLALFSGLSEQQRQEEERKAQEGRKVQVGQALSSLQTDRSPENVANVLLLFPELKEQITSSQSVLDEAGKKADLDFSSRLLTLVKSGRHDEASAVLDERIAALRNTPGKERELAATEAMAKSAKLDPKFLEMVGAVKMMAVAPELYKTIFGSGEPLDKDYDLNVRLFGKEQADLWRAGEEAKKGVITATGPAGAQYVKALEVSPMLAAQTATGGMDKPEMTPGQYMAAVNALGAEGGLALLRNNGIRVRVFSPQEIKGLPRGTPLLLPDGSEGVVP